MKKKFQLVLVLLAINFLSYSQNSSFSNFQAIGTSHNQGLNKFFIEYSADRVKSEKLNLRSLNVYMANQDIIGNPSFASSVLNNTIFANSRKSDLAGLSTSLVSQNAISNLCGSYVADLNNLVDNNSDVSALNSSIVTLEGQITSESRLSESEKGILLCATATAKSSSTFWNEEMQTLSSEWANGSIISFNSKTDDFNNTVLLNEENNIEKCSKSVSVQLNNNMDYENIVQFLYYWRGKILKADIAGAVSGGVAGALLGGAVATPLGSIPGWAAGALTGGVSGSVYEAVSQFLDWLF